MKCRESISNNSMYMPVSCMSTNDSFVYLAVGLEAYQVKFLQQSCSYLAMLPISDNITGSAFELLQKGFTLQYGSEERILSIEIYAAQIGLILLCMSRLVNILLNFIFILCYGKIEMQFPKKNIYI